MSQHEGSPRNSVRIEGEKLVTLSYPERSAWWFVCGVVGVTSLVCLLPLALTDEMGTGALATMLSILTLSALFAVWCVRVSRVSMTADASGIHLSTMKWIHTRIPWEATADIRPDSTGSGLHLGWKILGGGTIGYLAGKEALMIEIGDGARRRQGDQGAAEPPRKLPRRYLVSVPQSDLVSLKLRDIQSQHHKMAPRR